MCTSERFIDELFQLFTNKEQLHKYVACLLRQNVDSLSLQRQSIKCNDK
jgi:hypothetical protein